MGTMEHPQCDPDPDNNAVEASVEASDCQSQPGFVYLVKKNTFNWDLLHGRSPISQCFCGGRKPLNLELRTKKKIMKMTEKEEILVDVSKKAAEAARIREEELRKQAAILKEQNEENKSPT